MLSQFLLSPRSLSPRKLGQGATCSLSNTLAPLSLAVVASAIRAAPLARRRHALLLGRTLAPFITQRVG